MSAEALHVAVGIVRDATGRVLVARRPEGRHMAGYWEFPGGKVAPGEGVPAALARELHEELGIHVAGTATPLIRLSFSYPDRQVLLDVREVAVFEGTPRACEGQQLDWCEPRALYEHPMLPANRPIVDALCLPACYVITPPELTTPDEFAGMLRPVPPALVQLRPSPGQLQDADWLLRMRNVARVAGVPVLLNGPVSLAARLGFDGVHLNARRLRRLRRRPASLRGWLGASCHSAEELVLAARLPVDFAVLSPVRTTPSHPDRSPLGWDGFAALTREASFPVYALGGMTPGDVEVAREHGGQGVAGIRGFIPDTPSG